MGSTVMVCQPGCSVICAKPDPSRATLNKWFSVGASCHPVTHAASSVTAHSALIWLGPTQPLLFRLAGPSVDDHQFAPALRLVAGDQACGIYAAANRRAD